MKSNAPGQFLGYVTQFPRALLHLLRASPGDCVSIEYIGDVATEYSDGTSLVEEDKSSIISNPINDRSVNLWKTFSNWIDAIEDNDININKTLFLLFSTKTGNPALVNLFHKADQEKDANLAIEQAKEKLKKINSAHEIWPYYNNAINRNKTIFSKIIMRFSLETQEGGPYEEISKELRRKHVRESQITHLTDAISGWLEKTIIQKIQEKESPIVYWEDYDKAFKVYFERSRRRELIDFSLKDPPDEDSIKCKVKSYPLFVRQLDIIQENEESITEAVTDYLKAEVNRQIWIEDEFIDEETAGDFEKKLKSFWANTKDEIEIKHEFFDCIKKSKLLYIECKKRQQTIRDNEPPESTIAGTYHSLADIPEIGWHSDWKNLKEDK